MISKSHIKNSSDLLRKIDNINTENKFLASLDIKSLCINIPVNKCIKRLENPPQENKPHFTFNC